MTYNNTLLAALSQPPSSYVDYVQAIGAVDGGLNWFERLWAAWYAYMGNDQLATGILSFCMHELVYFGRAIPFIVMGQIAWFNRYKIQAGKIPSAADQWKCTAYVLLQHFTVELPQIWLFHPMAHFFGMETGVPFPSLLKMVFQVAVFFFAEDTWHYFAHRTLHWGPLYRTIHKIHHQYSAPFGLAAEYASPIEVMVLGFGTVGVPIVWCMLTGDLHILTMYTWIFLRLLQVIDAHSGYDFPWSLHNVVPFWGGADFHDVHHEKFIGNYSSSFRHWDWLMDTESSPAAILARRERKMAKARAARAAAVGANGNANGEAKKVL